VATAVYAIRPPSTRIGSSGAARRFAIALAWLALAATAVAWALAALAQEALAASGRDGAVPAPTPACLGGCRRAFVIGRHALNALLRQVGRQPPRGVDFDLLERYCDLTVADAKAFRRIKYNLDDAATSVKDDVVYFGYLPAANAVNIAADKLPYPVAG
jgi:hypothetical protein